MSFREIRQFIEIIRTLGYPQAIGLDSFDTPNFGLMAQLLQWLTNLYDPDIVVIPDLTGEHGRVEFIRSICQQMAIRSGIRLNSRKLYASDRQSVRELLKVASPIYHGLIACETPHKSSKSFNMSVPSSAVRINKFCGTVPKHAVDLYDQLDKELMIRDNRTLVLSRVPPLADIEKEVLAAVDGASTRYETLSADLKRLAEDEASLKSKINQRKNEFERQSKRLLSVQTIRPAFMDDYEELEKEIQDLFKDYSQQYRNVDYYEHELSIISEKQKEDAVENEKKIGKIKDKWANNLADNLVNSYKLGQKNPDPDLSKIGVSDNGDDIADLNAGGVDDSDSGF